MVVGMKSIKDIAESYGVDMFEHDGIVLCSRGGTRWFSGASTVRRAAEIADGDVDLFCEECDGLRTNGVMVPRFIALLDVLREQDRTTYDMLGGDHDEVIRRAT